MNELIYAKDYFCVTCGIQAQTFWPCGSPEFKPDPYCHPCADAAIIKVELESLEAKDIN